MSYTEEERRMHIFDLQNALYTLTRDSAPVLIPDGIYGAETTYAVQRVQQQNRLPPTGTVDLQTWETLFAQANGKRAAQSAPSPVAPFPAPMAVQRGQISAGVGMAQIMLWALSHRFQNIQSVPVTLIYDDATIAQMHTIQRLGQLPQSDTLTTETWNTLIALYESCCK